MSYKNELIVKFEVLIFFKKKKVMTYLGSNYYLFLIVTLKHKSILKSERTVNVRYA